MTLPDGEAVTQMETGAGPEVKWRRMAGLEAEDQGTGGCVEYRGRGHVMGGGGGGVHYGVWRRGGGAPVLIGGRRGRIEEGGWRGGKVGEGACCVR